MTKDNIYILAAMQVQPKSKTHCHAICHLTARIWSNSLLHFLLVFIELFWIFGKKIRASVQHFLIDYIVDLDLVDRPSRKPAYNFSRNYLLYMIETKERLR